MLNFLKSDFIVFFVFGPHLIQILFSPFSTFLTKISNFTLIFMNPSVASMSAFGAGFVRQGLLVAAHE